MTLSSAVHGNSPIIPCVGGTTTSDFQKVEASITSLALQVLQNGMVYGGVIGGVIASTITLIVASPLTIMIGTVAAAVIFGVAGGAWISSLYPIVPLVADTDPVLRQRAIDVPNQLNIDWLVDAMIRTMKWRGGVGLAAPQIGVSLKVFVARETRDSEVLVCINPTFEKTANSGDEEKKEECLSFPGQKIFVKRAKAGELSYQDNDGQRKAMLCHGDEARIVQHEIDHLYGKVIVDNDLK